MRTTTRRRRRNTLTGLLPIYRRRNAITDALAPWLAPATSYEQWVYDESDRMTAILEQANDRMEQQLQAFGGPIEPLPGEVRSF